MFANSVLIWNVRGLNMRARREVVREFWSQEHASVLCLVETKLSAMSLAAMANDLMGTNFDYVLVPSVGLSCRGASCCLGTRMCGSLQTMSFDTSPSRHV